MSSGSSYQRLMYNDGQNNTSQIAWNNDNDWGIVSETIQLDDGTAFAFYTKNNEIKSSKLYKHVISMTPKWANHVMIMMMMMMMMRYTVEPSWHQNRLKLDVNNEKRLFENT